MKPAKWQPNDFAGCFERALEKGATPLKALEQARHMFPGAPILSQPGKSREGIAAGLEQRYREFPQLRR
jgi:hypothetical protein